MIPTGPGRPLLAALLLCTGGAAHAGSALQVVAQDGSVMAALPFPPASEICLEWAHSVTGGAVADCFRNDAGQAFLVRSFLHDSAAGLGEVPGRGVMSAAPGGGYVITGIDEPLPPGGLALRVGPASVGHTLIGAAGVLDLSALAPNQRVLLRLVP